MCRFCNDQDICRQPWDTSGHSNKMFLVDHPTGFKRCDLKARSHIETELNPVLRP